MSFLFLFLAIVIGVGLISCFWGQKIFSIVLTLCAFLAAYHLTAARLANDPNVMVIALGAAVLAALLAQYAKKAAFFLMGFLLGLILGSAAVAQLAITDPLMHGAVVLGCGVILGIVFVHWNKLFIRIGTSYFGGYLIGTAGFFLIMNYQHLNNYVNPDAVAQLSDLSRMLFTSFADQYALYILVIALIFTVIGTHYQKRHH